MKTILVVNQLSGRQLGIRVDIMPQVARIDTHPLSANRGINRLCYAGLVPHARPDGLLSMREPSQVGAEMYGLEGIEADIESIDLMLKSMKITDMGEVPLSLSHIGVFRALAHAAHLDEQKSATLLSLMQDRDAEAVNQLVREWKLDGMQAKAFSLLPRLYDSCEVLTLVREKLPELSAVSTTLDKLQAVCDTLPNQKVHIDLSELHVDNYHTGLLYAVYGSNLHDAVARGGRYDGLGGYFGRAHPAAGFSFDLCSFIGRPPATGRESVVAADVKGMPVVQEVVDALCEQGQCVVIDYGTGYDGSEEVTDRLKQVDGVQKVINLSD